jgi:integrase
MYRTSNGVQKIRRGFASRRAARAWRAQQVAAAARGEVVDNRDNFGSYIDRWLRERRPHLEDGTYRNYELDIRLRLKPYFDTRRLADIKTEDVRAFVTELAEAGKLAPKTINNSLKVLSVALGDAEDDGLIVRNPARVRRGRRDRLKLPDAHREMDYLRLHEIPRYLDACPDYYRPLAEVLIATGLRISEALALRWSDIDWRQRSLRVVRSGKQSGEEGSTKGDRSRSVAFGPRIERVLRDHQARLTRHELGDPESGIVFVGPLGGRLDRSDISRDLHKSVLQAAGLRKGLRLHDLRHTAAASWLASGLPLIYVQRQLGHASITTTEQQYGHLEEDYLRDAPIRVEERIWRDAPAPA